MKKIITVITLALFAIFLTSCEDLKEIVNEVENIIIEESLNKLTEEVGIEDFVLPEYEDLSIKFEYEEENDYSKLELEIEQPKCELEEYKNQLVSYVEQALSEHVDIEEIDSFEPTEIENGYLWKYTYDKVLEDGTIKEVVVEVELTKDEGDFELDLELTNLGDIFKSIKEDIEEETQNQ